MSNKFVRRDFKRYSKLGKKRKKLQKWRRPSGRDNKIREKRFSYPKSPSVGYKSPKKSVGKIEGLDVSLVRNLRDLEKTDKKSAIIIGRIGMKKKMEIIKKAVENNFKIINFGKRTKAR